jgi:catechol 2,3-dioxygenase-like lactoylglutathione lyase family enzyme
MKMVRRLVVGGLISLIFSSAVAPSETVRRPRILGIAHVAFYVSELEKSRAFYKDFLGYDEPFSLKRPDGTDRIAFIKINDQQYLELFAENPKQPELGRLNHVAVYVDSASQMRDYLAAHGIKVPDTVAKGRTGNYNFTITDPDGHGLEFVEYQPDSQTGRNNGKSMPASRISNHIMHAGILVEAVEPAMKFYRDLLGFREFWRGSADSVQLSWINLRVPDGDDYVEFMLYQGLPTPEQQGVKNHICLVSQDVQKSAAELDSRPARKSYSRSIEVHVGKNRRRQANLFDPDGTRIELMEPATIDGQPALPSHAPPPR